MPLDSSDLALVIECLFDRTPVPGASILRQTPSSVWLGSGLAKISAFHGASLIGKLSGRPSRVMTALEYCQHRKVSCLPLLVTLRGRNEDATGLASSIIERKAKQAVLLTGDRQGEAATMLIKSEVDTVIAEATLPSADKRFINCKATFVLASLTYRLIWQSLYGPDCEIEVNEQRLTAAFMQAANTSEYLAQQIIDVGDWRNCPIFILSDGYPSELSITWMSILAESGIVHATCADIKDYTHGEHLATSLRGKGIFIVLRHSGIADICDIFARRFSLLFPMITIDLRLDSAERFWENLFYTCNVASWLSRSLGYQGVRPPKHPIVWTWRGWGDIHRL